MKRQLLKFSVLFLLIHSSCNDDISGIKYEAEILENFGVRTERFDSIFYQVLPRINALLIENRSKYQLRLSNDFNISDSSHLLLIPITPYSRKVSASSNINMRFIVFNPAYVEDLSFFTMLDAENLSEISTLIILHEVCHFELGIGGKLDNIISNIADTTFSKNDSLSLNQMKLVELKTDSLAALFIEKGTRSTIEAVRQFASKLKIQLQVLEASLFIDRLTDHFGTDQMDLLKDISSSHPNFELRISFMNYYITKDTSKFRTLQYYLKQREITFQK